jgi:hypothetical protein
MNENGSEDGKCSSIKFRLLINKAQLVAYAAGSSEKWREKKQRQFC